MRNLCNFLNSKLGKILGMLLFIIASLLIINSYVKTGLSIVLIFSLITYIATKNTKKKDSRNE